jgi:Flp pilus assembly protein TadG
MRLLRNLRRFGAGRAGLAAVEFALLLPMMVALLLGSVDLINAMDVSRRVQNVAASLADVVSRDTEVSDAEVTGLWSAANLLMYPMTANTMSERITSISVTSPTMATVVWSEAHNGYEPLSVNSTVALPEGMMTAGTSVIMTETRYPYSSPLGFLFNGGVNITHTAYRRSREVDSIPRVP